VLRTTRKLTDARMALGMLHHRLREGGPTMTRAEMRERVKFAFDILNEIVPASPLRDAQPIKSNT
jgi:hypothetical protein